MKGFINEYGVDIAPCGTCKYKNKLFTQKPCRSCIKRADLKKPDNEKEFMSYEKEVEE